MDTNPGEQPQFRWSSRLSFVLAASGFAVGLGNIWRFPYLTGENGGAAFLVVYLLCAFGIGMPLIMAELMLGRHGKRGIVSSLRAVAGQSRASRKWSWIGVLALLATFLILSYYVVIAGWTLDYALKASEGAFSEVEPVQSTALFGELMESPWRMLGWTLATVALTGLVVARGLKGGIEKVTSFIMPLFFVGLILLAIYALFFGDMGSAIDFLFVPDFSKIDGTVVAMAVGQAFFSVGVGFGTMVSFGSYLDDDVSIASTAGIIVAADTAVALIAGLIIFPFVFRYGLEVTSGPGLVFETLPVAIGAMPAGQLVGVVFFLLLFIAAITSCVGLLEPLAARVRHWFDVRLSTATVIMSVLVALVSVGSVLSFNRWAEFHPLETFGVLADQTIYVVQDYVAVNIFLPLGALLMALFVGWFASKDIWREQLATSARIFAVCWLPVMRFVVPPAIASIMVISMLG